MFGKLGTVSKERIFVNRNIKNWNQLPAEALGSFLVNIKFLESVRKAFINKVK